MKIFNLKLSMKSYLVMLEADDLEDKASSSDCLTSINCFFNDLINGLMNLIEVKFLIVKSQMISLIGIGI